MAGNDFERVPTGPLDHQCNWTHLDETGELCGRLSPACGFAEVNLAFLEALAACGCGMTAALMKLEGECLRIVNGGVK